MYLHNHSIFGFVPQVARIRFALRISRLVPAVAAVLALVPAALSEQPDIVRMAGGQGERVNTVTFSPDGRMLASGTGPYGLGDFPIKLWRASDGELLNVLRGHTGGVFLVAFSPDGQTLASASWDSTVRLWRVADGSLLKTLTGHAAQVWSVAFAPDRNALFTAWNAIANLADLAGKVQVTVEAESPEGFDKGKPQNGLLEPLREADLIE